MPMAREDGTHVAQPIGRAEDERRRSVTPTGLGRGKGGESDPMVSPCSAPLSAVVLQMNTPM
jgi:hypothetical protein